MTGVPVNYVAVVVAGIAGFLVGWGWYTLFGKVWQAELGRENGHGMKPSPVPFIIALISALVMAWMLAGLMSHLDNVTVRGGLITAFFVWFGFVLTTIAVNQSFQGVRPIVTAIDTGHWLAALMVMGAIIGAFGVPA